MSALNTNKFRKKKSLYIGNLEVGVNDAETSLTFTSLAGLPTDTAITLTLDRVDANGDRTPTLMERVTGVVTGDSLINCIRGVDGSTAKSHDAGAVLEDIWEAGTWNDLVDGLLVGHGQLGEHTSDLVTTLKATGATVNTQTSDTTIVTPKALADSYLSNGYTSMSRQALINGNFDIWQRGTTVTNATNGTYIADRWINTINGTLPSNVITSRQPLTSGDIANSFYFYRVNPDGAGTFGTGKYYIVEQRIENGTRYLAGASKKVTLSFWARSSISNKKLGLELVQYYGTGGSPSTSDYIPGTSTITLTSTWTKYTQTFTTATLVGKTFGTDNNDFLSPSFWMCWGSDLTGRVNASGAETFVGSGNIDIAQVQLCAGDVALPFAPKSVNQEMSDCKRFFQKLGGSSNYNWYGLGRATGTTVAQVFIPYLAEMRKIPTVTYATANTHLLNSIAVTAVNNDIVGTRELSCNVGVASGLTTGDAAIFCDAGSNASYIYLDADY